MANEILKAVGRGDKSLFIDFRKLEKFDIELADELINNPEEVLKAFEEVLLDLSGSERTIKVRLKNLPENLQLKIKDLRSYHLGKLVIVEGIIRQASEVRPEVVKTSWECPVCGNEILIFQSGMEIEKPKECICGNRKGFILKNKEFTDVQRIVIEENPETLEGGEQPSRLSVILRHDLVDPHFRHRTMPGTLVRVWGVLKEVPLRSRESKRYDIFLEANYLETLVQEFKELEITRKDVEEILEIAKSGKAWELIVNSIAPSIYGHEKVKEAIALQLFGGVRKKRPDGTWSRGDIHILLVGDPGSGKSQILKYVAGLAPKARYVSGKGASAVGLTATVVKDEFLKGWTLEAGAIVLANGGIVCIDEMDKISKEDIFALHEAMEQQSYHPDTTLLLADGRRVRIGEFVEELFTKYRDRAVVGKDCLILPVRDLGIKVLTTDFKRVFAIPIDRVSKHVAPSIFVKITFSNGRSVTVTPEHPVYVRRGGRIMVVRADEVRVGDVCPAPRRLPIPHAAFQDRLREALEKARIEEGQVIIVLGERERAEEMQEALLAAGLSSVIKEGGSYEVLVEGEPSEVMRRLKDPTDPGEALPGVGWVEAVKVETLPNDGAAWVYDVTVEPTRTFIGECLVLHNTVSIAKAGIVATLNARTSILAAANPAFGRYLHNRPVTENIDLPPTILSRFDLIFVITDTPNAEGDRALAEYVLDFHRQYYPESLEHVIPRDLLKKYIAYARKHVRPRLSEEAKKKLVDFYVEMRTKSQGVDSPIAITPRQLEALVRLAEAHAKMALSEIVMEKDAEAAIELMMAFLRSVGYDVESKRIDIDIVMTGQPKSQRDKIVMILDMLERMMKESGGEPVEKEEIVERAVEKGLDELFVRKVLEKLYESGEIIEPRPGYIMLLKSR